MYDNEGSKHDIRIINNLLDCWKPYQHIHLKEKNMYYSI